MQLIIAVYQRRRKGGEKMACNCLEIERKFLIRKPDKKWLETEAEGWDMVQTYLIKDGSGLNSRVRKSSGKGGSVFTHTQKRHISAMSREEYEREISEEEYNKLLLTADPKRRTIEKRRYVLMYKDQRFEIDLFPFWSDRAIMEIELEREDQAVDFPPEINIIREVTEDRRYTNSSLAREIPMETLD